jgi:pheromone shutdown protein TraB
MQSSLRFLFFLRDLRALGGSLSDLEKTMNHKHFSIAKIVKAGHNQGIENYLLMNNPCLL